MIAWGVIMNMPMRIFWLAVLLIFTAGCSTYKMASMPGVATETNQGTTEKCQVKVGDQVRITLKDGSEQKGKILEISGDRMLLEPKHTGPAKAPEPPPVWFDGHEIQSLEKSEFQEGKTLLMFTAVLVGFVVLGLAMSDSEWEWSEASRNAPVWGKSDGGP